MKRTIQQITQQLISHLPENNQYYRPDELPTKYFPSFIVRNIQIKIERKLAEAIVLPKTDWVNFQSEDVQHAWQQFVYVSRTEARLPANYAKPVIKAAVTGVLKMLLQPRKNIPDVIFRQDDKLNYKEVSERIEEVVVYRHFGQLIPRYMQKKEIKSLSRERCAAIIENTDQRLTQQYSPLNWAQMLEPLFILLNGKVDTKLLRLFFEDKNKSRIARRFDLINDSLSRAQLIETLSSPDLLNFEGYEDEQSSLFEGLPHMKKAETLEERKETADDNPAKEDKNNDKKQFLEEPEGIEEEKSKNSLKTGLLESDADEVEEEDYSINAVFAEDDSDERDQNIFSPPVYSEDSSLKKDSDPVKQNQKTETNGKNTRETEDEESSEGLDKETPMWMRFFNEEEDTDSENRVVSDEDTGNSFKRDSENIDEDGFIDEPVIDLTSRPQPFAKERKELLELLSDDRELFVEEIFGGSNKAFDEAVDEIISYENWRSASKYIEKEVFKRNLINIYSEPAVNFTDRLQSYFLEKQNRK